MNEILESQQTAHISPSEVSYGVSIVRILEKIDCDIMTPECISGLIHCYLGTHMIGVSEETLNDVNIWLTWIHHNLMM